MIGRGVLQQDYLVICNEALQDNKAIKYKEKFLFLSTNMFYQYVIEKCNEDEIYGIFFRCLSFDVAFECCKKFALKKINYA